MTSTAFVAMSEAQVQKVITDALSACGYRWVHFRPGQTQGGRWMTPYSGNDGFPDIVALKDGRILSLECKGKSGAKKPGPTVKGSSLKRRITWEEQQTWLDEFDLAGAFAMFVTPSTLDMALKEIQR